MKKKLVKKVKIENEEVVLYGVCHAACTCPPPSVPNAPELESGSHHYNEWQTSMS